MRKRPVLFATLAVVVVGTAGAASVFLVGSKQRHDDRAAYLAYERAILAPLGVVRAVAGEMRTGSTRANEAARWSADLARARATLIGLEPPSFLKDAGVMWVAAVDAYNHVAAMIATSPPGSQSGLLRHADDLFDRAARLMSFHRSRLGLGRSTAPELG